MTPSGGEAGSGGRPLPRDQFGQQLGHSRIGEQCEVPGTRQHVRLGAGVPGTTHRDQSISDGTGPPAARVRRQGGRNGDVPHPADKRQPVRPAPGRRRRRCARRAAAPTGGCRADGGAAQPAGVRPGPGGHPGAGSPGSMRCAPAATKCRWAGARTPAEAPAHPSSDPPGRSGAAAPARCGAGSPAPQRGPRRSRRPCARCCTAAAPGSHREQPTVRHGCPARRGGTTRPARSRRARARTPPRARWVPAAPAAAARHPALPPVTPRALRAAPPGDYPRRTSGRRTTR